MCLVQPLRKEGFFVPDSPKGEAEAELMAYLEQEQHGILVNGGHIDPDAISAIQEDWCEHPRDGQFTQAQVTIPKEDFNRTVVIGLIFEDPTRFQPDGTVFFSKNTITYLQSLGLPVTTVTPEVVSSPDHNDTTTQTAGFINNL